MKRKLEITPSKPRGGMQTNKQKNINKLYGESMP